MLPPGAKVVGYARVSTEDQAETGSSMRAQPDAIAAHCSRLGLDLVGVEEDGGESSATMDRPGLRRVLARIDRGEVRGLVVAHVDRLTRSIEDAAVLVRLYFGRPDGPLLISAGEPVDVRTAIGRLMFFFLINVSQFQREAGVERTLETLGNKRDAAELLGRGRFGVRVDPADPRRSKAGNPVALVPDPVAAAALGVIHDRRRLGWSLARIAAELDRLGFPTVRGGERWARSTVGQLLRDYPIPPAPEAE